MLDFSLCDFCHFPLRHVRCWKMASSTAPVSLSEKIQVVRGPLSVGIYLWLCALQLASSDETCATFVIHEEGYFVLIVVRKGWRHSKIYLPDHTLGNSLRYVLSRKYWIFIDIFCFFLSSHDQRSAEVSFVGYSIPHPSEPKMNLRLQTRGSFFKLAGCSK